MSRVRAEAILRDATGGDQPKVHSIMRFGLYGWKFVSDNFLGAFDSDPSDPPEGSFWFNKDTLRMGIRIGDKTYYSPQWEET